MRNVITKAVGVESDVEVDYFELEENDNFAVPLCSDGLTNYCTDNMIYETVFGNNLDEAINSLLLSQMKCRRVKIILLSSGNSN